MIIERPILLIVDDSKNDELLLRAAFERAGFSHTVQFVSNGDEAIAYLQAEGPYSDRATFPMPTVVLMDLNMPRRNGFELLAWIRRNRGLRRLHVYILSASNRPEDIDRAYDLGANSFLVKPSNLDGLVQMIKDLGAWLKLSHFSPVQNADAGPESIALNGHAKAGEPIHLGAQGSS